MNNALRTGLFAICSTAAAGALHAQNFGGGATFTMGPNSQVGTPTNALVVTSLPNGFVATGTVTVSVPVPAAGTLAFWQLDRPFTLGSPTTFFTSTSIDGFVAPPPGTFSPTSGTLRTYVIDTANNNILPGTTSQIPLSLVNGATFWPLLPPTNSPSFTLPAYNFYAVRQVFDLDGVYASGPGGSWVIDVPAASTITAVPELPTAALLALGGLVLAWRRAAARPRG
jgi:hypothetical protein